jgi:hypothetical protein
MADSIREALEAAISTSSDSDTSVAQVPAVEPASAEVSQKPDPVEPKSGTPEPKVGTPSEPTQKPAVSGPSSDAPAQPSTTAQAVEIKAPASWKAEEKAAWAQVPPGAQKAIQRREQETARVLQDTAEARRTAQAFKEVLHPFEPLLQQYNVRDPANEVIRPLLQTRAALELGTPEQKAELVANMVYQFGVDVSKLDEFLVNMERSGKKPQPIQQQAQAPRAPSLRDNPELAPLFSIAERLQQAEHAKAQAAVDEIAQNEHFESVREDVADILEASAARGKTIPLKQAFEAALRLNGIEQAAPPPPQVTTSEAAAILAKSRNAAASVAGAPKGSPAGKPKTLRDTLEAAFNS